MSSCGSTTSLGNNKAECPVCKEELTAKHVFNHLIKKHQTEILLEQTKESIGEMIDQQRSFLAYNEDSIVLQGCLGCCKGFSNEHKASKHFKEKPSCLKEHVKQLNHLKALVKKSGKYTSKEAKDYLKTNGYYRSTDQSDKNRCGYFYGATSMKGWDKYLTWAIGTVKETNDTFDVAIKVLTQLNTMLQIKDEQEIYTNDWYRKVNIVWFWLGRVQDDYVRAVKWFDFLKYTPYSPDSESGDANEVELYLNASPESYKYEPIDLECVKAYNELKNPISTREAFLKSYAEDMKRMKEQEEFIKREKQEMARRMLELDERAKMYERDEEEEDVE